MRFYHIEIDMYQTDNYIYGSAEQNSLEAFALTIRAGYHALIFFCHNIYHHRHEESSDDKSNKNQNNGNIGPISLFNDYNNYVIKWINKQLVKLNKLC